ncbi:hypothetical protein ACQCVB_17745 [Fictibacillus phosphorivorans]|uniref:hypothetical protein n=1 Tax=Fictibacillus phosphorivorans TaxID=1221500 RepID=UPI003CE8074D
MAKKLFIEKDVTLDGIEGEYRNGGIYEFNTNADNQDANKRQEYLHGKLLETGVAHVVDFPQLQALENSMATLVKEHKAKKQQIKDSKRYRDNEAEREYQLEQLEIKLDEDIARVKAEYTKELELTERELALKAVQEVHAVDEGVQRWLGAEIAQLAYSDDQELDLQLMLTKVSAFNEQQLATVLSNASKIKQAINGNAKAEAVLKDIVAVAKRSNKATEINLKLRQLKALKGQNVDVAYQNYKRAKQNGGSI